MVFHKKKFRKRGRKRATRRNRSAMADIKPKYMARQGLIKYYGRFSNPIPERYQCKLTTSLIGQITAASVGDSYKVKLNSLFQPFNTSNPLANPLGSSLALQPVGSIALGKNYFNYRVFASKITVQMIPTSLTAAITFGIIPTSFSAASQTIQQMMAQPYAKTSTMNVYDDAKANRITSFVYIPRTLGISSRAYQDDLSGQYTGTNSATTGPQSDPLTIWNWIIAWGWNNGASAAANLNYSVKVTHYAEFWQEELGLVV